MLLSNNNKIQLEQLCEMIKGCDGRFIIVSPYLAKDLDKFLKAFDFSSVNEVDLITTFKPNDIEQVTKPFQIRRYFQYFSSQHPNIQARVSIDNSLHGKLFFGLGSAKRLILTSANFTNNGLRNNNEWGVLISDESMIEQALDEVFEEIDYPDVTRYQIDRACQFSEVYLTNHPEWTVEHDIPSNILEEVYSDSSSANTDVKYFLKPIGDSKLPITLEDTTDFAALHQDLHFSTKKPKGVRKGDVLITVAVGAGSLLGYFNVTSGLRFASPAQQKEHSWMQRWPWYVEGRNQNREFSAEWNRYNLRSQDLLSEFRERNPKESITHTGGSTLGTLNFGSDKVRLSEPFAEFLISKMDTCVDKRKTV